MLATKNKEIKKALNILEIVSQDEKTRMLYEAREAEIRDQITRIESARKEGHKKGREEGLEKGRKEGMEKGREEGLREGMKELAVKLIKRGIDIDIIIQASNLSREEIEALKEN